MSSVKLPNFLRGVFQIAHRLPGVFSFTITGPSNKVLESATKELRVSYMVDFIFLFAVDCDWVRRGWR